jgi:hypothetical protein
VQTVKVGRNASKAKVCETDPGEVRLESLLKADAGVELEAEIE